jgi:hypothetical protein
LNDLMLAFRPSILLHHARDVVERFGVSRG